MSSLFGMCPAPFQKPKKSKSKSKTKARSAASSSRPAPLPTIVDQLPLGPVEHTQVRRGACCCEGGQCMTQTVPSSSASMGSHSTHTSGYHTDDGTFEGKLLGKATRSRPANITMTSIRDYSPCCHEELAVRKGQRVKVLYKNNDWVYAVTKAGEAGYIPYSFVRPSRKYAGYQSEPEYCQDTDATYASGYDTDMPVSSGRVLRTQVGDVPMYSLHTTGFNGSSPESKRPHQHQHQNQRRFVSGYSSAVESSTPSAMYRGGAMRPAKSVHNILDSSPKSNRRPVEPKPVNYQRSFLEELVVIHDFEAKEEDEVFAGKGERVKVLNADDPFWLWVETTPGDQGFVPRSCCSLGNHELLHSNASRRASVSTRAPPATRHARKYYYDRSRAQAAAKQVRSTAKQRFHELARLRNTPQNPVLMTKEEIQRIGSKLIVLMDYTATQDDELNVQFAETIFADVLKQGGADRIWAYCPREERCGYVPVSLVVPPVV